MKEPPVLRSCYYWFFALFVSILGCGKPATVIPHVNLDETASQLRDAFNRDVAKTRILMLTSPT